MLFGSEDDESNSTKPEREYPHPFKNCIVLGLMLTEWYESKDGKQRFLTEEEAKSACGSEYVLKTGKMSKQLRNYPSPQQILINMVLMPFDGICSPIKHRGTRSFIVSERSAIASLNLF